MSTRPYECPHLKEALKSDTLIEYDHLYSLFVNRASKQKLFCDFCSYKAHNPRMWYCMVCFAGCCFPKVENHLEYHHRTTGHTIFADFSRKIMSCFICNRVISLINTKSLHFGDIYIDNKNTPPAFFTVPQDKISTYTSIIGKDKAENLFNNMEGGLSGFINVGNSCYMNSTMQVLIHLPKFVSLLLRLPELTHIYENNSNAEFLKNFTALAAAQWSGRYKIINPRQLFFNTWKLNPAFEGYTQQDAHEFLNMFIFYLREQTSVEIADGYETIEKKLPFQAPDLIDKIITKLRGKNQLRLKQIGCNKTPLILYSGDATTPIDDIMTEVYSNIAKLKELKGIFKDIFDLEDIKRLRKPHRIQTPTQKSTVKDLFFGELETVITCTQCNQESKNIDEFLGLGLDIVTAGMLRKNTGHSFGSFQYVKEMIGFGEKAFLKNLLAYHFRDELLTDGNSYFCMKCMDEVTAIKKTKIVKFPEILIIQLKRFTHSAIMGGSKVHTKVGFPIENLKLHEQYNIPVKLKKKKQKNNIHEHMGEEQYEPFENVGEYEDFDKLKGGSVENEEDLPILKDVDKEKDVDKTEAKQQEKIKKATKKKEDFSEPTGAYKVYDLEGLVIHTGSLNSGHYYSAAKHHNQQSWYLFNDRKVELIDEEKLNKYYPYLLFYSMKSESLNKKLSKYEVSELMENVQIGEDGVLVDKTWVKNFELYGDIPSIGEIGNRCKHGYKIKGGNKSSIKISKKTYQSLVSNFNNEHMLNKETECLICLEENLDTKRIQELYEIEENLKLFKEVDKIASIEKEWVIKWQKFVYFESDELPTKIKKDKLRIIEFEDIENEVSNKGRAIINYAIYKHILNKHIRL